MSTDQSKKSTNQLTTVKTIYARAAVLLLALNFCLTGYVVMKLNDSVQTQMDTATQMAPALQTSATASGPQPESIPSTLENKE